MSCSPARLVIKPALIPALVSSRPYCARMDSTSAAFSTAMTGATRFDSFHFLPSLLPAASGSAADSISPGSSPTLSMATMKNPPVSSRWGMMRTHRSRFISRALDDPGGHIEDATFRCRRPPPSGRSCQPNASPTSHAYIPGLRFNPSSSPLTSTSFSAPLARFNSAATTASSSNGFSEQVLYTSRPPTLSRRAACDAISSCSVCRSTPDAGVHFFHRSGDLRNVPSPEHGTSARMRSNLYGSRFDDPPASSVGYRVGNFCAWWLVTMSAGELLRLVWCVSRLARCRDASLATTTPVGKLPSSRSSARAWSISRS